MALQLWVSVIQHNKPHSSVGSNSSVFPATLVLVTISSSLLQAAEARSPGRQLQQNLWTENSGFRIAVIVCAAVFGVLLLAGIIWLIISCTRHKAAVVPAEAGPGGQPVQPAAASPHERKTQLQYSQPGPHQPQVYAEQPMFPQSVPAAALPGAVPAYDQSNRFATIAAAAPWNSYPASPSIMLSPAIPPSFVPSTSNPRPPSAPPYERLVLISSRVWMANKVAEAALPNVATVVYDWKNFTLQELLRYIKKTVGNQKLTSIAVIAPGNKAGTVSLLDGETTSTASLAEKGELLQFWRVLAGSVSVNGMNDGRRIDLLGSRVVESPREGAALLRELWKLTAVPFAAADDALGGYNLATFMEEPVTQQVTMISSTIQAIDLYFSRYALQAIPEPGSPGSDISATAAVPPVQAAAAGQYAAPLPPGQPPASAVQYCAVESPPLPPAGSLPQAALWPVPPPPTPQQDLPVAQGPMRQTASWPPQSVQAPVLHVGVTPLPAHSSAAPVPLVGAGVTMPVVAGAAAATAFVPPASVQQHQQQPPPPGGLHSNMAPGIAPLLQEHQVARAPDHRTHAQPMSTVQAAPDLGMQPPLQVNAYAYQQLQAPMQHLPPLASPPPLPAPQQQQRHAKVPEDIFSRFIDGCHQRQFTPSEVFRTYDRNRNGELDKAEIIQMFRDIVPGATEAEVMHFQAMQDINHDDRVTEQELLTGLAAHAHISVAVAAGQDESEVLQRLMEYLSTNEDLLRSIFDEYDQDHAGQLDHNELQALVSSIPGLSVEEQKYIMVYLHQYDKNTDGKLTYDELLQVVQSFTGPLPVHYALHQTASDSVVQQQHAGPPQQYASPYSNGSRSGPAPQYAAGAEVQTALPYSNDLQQAASMPNQQPLPHQRQTSTSLPSLQAVQPLLQQAANGGQYRNEDPQQQWQPPPLQPQYTQQQWQPPPLQPQYTQQQWQPPPLQPQYTQQQWQPPQQAM